MPTPCIGDAPLHAQGYYEARPGDVVARGDLRVVDVRHEDDLLGDHGHIHGAWHVPADRLCRDGLAAPSDRPLVVVCDNGGESRVCATALVRDHGFQEIYLLVGGMLRWHAEGRPVARTRTWK